MDDYPYKCRKCSAEYINSTGLRAHRRYVHSILRWFRN